MATFARIGEMVLNLDELAAILRILPTDEAKGHIEICLKTGRAFSVTEGSPSYDELAAWLKRQPAFEVE